MKASPQLKDLQEQFRSPDLVPGSDEERALLAEARAMKQNDTGTFRVVKREALSASMTPEGVVLPDAARHAAGVAVEHVTGVHEAVTPEKLAAAQASVTPVAEVRQQAL